MLGMKFKLAKDWHTYWENPGDAEMALDEEGVVDYNEGNDCLLYTSPSPRDS